MPKFCHVFFCMCVIFLVKISIGVSFFHGILRTCEIFWCAAVGISSSCCWVILLLRVRGQFARICHRRIFFLYLFHNNIHQLSWQFIIYLGGYSFIKAFQHNKLFEARVSQGVYNLNRYDLVIDDLRRTPFGTRGPTIIKTCTRLTLYYFSTHTLNSLIAGFHAIISKYWYEHYCYPQIDSNSYL